MPGVQGIGLISVRLIRSSCVQVMSVWSRQKETRTMYCGVANSVKHEFAEHQVIGPMESEDSFQRKLHNRRRANR
ncbi:hypothetical protein FIBSPDRAFT_859211 [Athelia psychrophila]|uniref:Uncharacterized protein n=1 Tax=Athelia psychrophila TaxID=1759441 RepID=A0A166LAC1_9AGAM|nr:hypothetical protein FIBSPDRAFT_859211 [Fibularhizoctonia sp. CBS 109695]